MKKILTIAALVLCSTMAFSQPATSTSGLSSRAKAMRMMNFSREEYMIKDIKVYTDTMTVYSLSNIIIYPFGQWESMEQYITDNQLHWYRESGYRKFFDSMEVSVNRMKRLDDSYLDMFYSIWTRKVELLGGRINDPEVILTNGIHVGMSKDDVFKVFFKKYPKSYTSEVAVLKVISGAGEVAEIYTFKGQKLRHIKIETAYKYY
ncbi:MAG: hypothetical protein IJR04_06455 [Bacteroidales bacterium]|nr:hypothetical protein [Bacteroidales bacterium]